MVSHARLDCVSWRFCRAGQRVILVAGVPLVAPVTTNMLRIASVGRDATKIFRLSATGAPVNAREQASLRARRAALEH